MEEHKWRGSLGSFVTVKSAPQYEHDASPQSRRDFARSAATSLLEVAAWHRLRLRIDAYASISNLIRDLYIKNSSVSAPESLLFQIRKAQDDRDSVFATFGEYNAAIIEANAVLFDFDPPVREFLWGRSVAETADLIRFASFWVVDTLINMEKW